jgi:DNA-binding transcriptional MerR regulator
MDDKMIDVHYEDINKKYYTIDEVANILKIEQSSIFFYFEKLNDFLNIKSVGIYQLFDDTDVKNLKRIRDLEINQNMSIKEIKKYLSQNKQEILLEKESNTQVDKSVLNIFQQFANALMEQNRKIDEVNKTNVKLIDIIDNLSINQEKLQLELREQKELNQRQLDEYNKNNKELNEQLDSTKNEIATDIESKLNQYQKQMNNNFNGMSSKIINENKKELEELKKDIKYISHEEIKKISEEKKQHQGFFERMFSKKK